MRRWSGVHSDHATNVSANAARHRRRRDSPINQTRTQISPVPGIASCGRNAWNAEMPFFAGRDGGDADIRCREYVCVSAFILRGCGERRSRAWVSADRRVGTAPISAAVRWTMVVVERGAFEISTVSSTVCTRRLRSSSLVWADLGRAPGGRRLNRQCGGRAAGVRGSTSSSEVDPRQPGLTRLSPKSDAGGGVGLGGGGDDGGRWWSACYRPADAPV